MMEPAPELAAGLRDAFDCPECSYDLRGSGGARCPECGLELDFIDAPASLIPWARSHSPRALVQTLWLLIWRPKQLYREKFRAVDYHAAQRFRWVCVAWAMLWWILLVPIAASVQPGVLETAVADWGWGLISLAYAGLGLTLIWQTGAPSYLFHPRHLTVRAQNRALALSYYTSGWLALTVLPVLSLWVSLATATLKRWDILWVLALILAISFQCMILIAQWGSLRYAASVLLRTRTSVWKVSLLVPLLWLVGGFATLVLVPAIGLWIVLVRISLQ